jgi:hypothetical protein
MMKILFCLALAAAVTALGGRSHAIDLGGLADQSTYRCTGGVVALGDSDRSVRDKCGDPLQVGRRQDFGPIWIYYQDQGSFMYYLAFVNGRLQRIVSAPCTPDDPDCLDLR